MLIFCPDADLFQSEADALCNAVNCVGVMGGGLARDFRLNFPREMNDEYIQMCETRLLTPGTLHVWKGKDTKIVINFPTKDDFKHPSRMEYIVDGLVSLREWCEIHPDKSVAIPKLGCGLGLLKWEDVRVAIIDALETVPNTIYVYGEGPGE
jgi:O-acetyl-ADP-ribose deacetylase (regulator of RNase III)